MGITLREKRVVILGGCIVAVVLLAYAGTMLIPSREGLARDVENKRKMLLREREMIGREDFYKARIDQYRMRLDQAKARLLPGENPSIAGAELQRSLKEICDQNGIELIRRDIQREQSMPDNLIKISVKVETRCEPDQLVKLLAAIGSYEKYLIVEELTITSFKIQKKWTISPVLTIVGYITAPAASSAAKPQ